MKKIAAVLAVASASLFIVLAFSWGESSAEAKADFCNSLQSLSSTVMSYEGLDVRTATSDDLDAAADDINDAWDEVVDDAEDWANAYDNPLNIAYNDLYWEIQYLPSDNTVAENYDAVEDELAAFPEAYSETFDGSGCTAS
jgi:hypothetical protein